MRPGAWLPVLAVLACSAVSVRCATPSTTLVRSWRSPSYASGAFHRPFVLAVANDRNVRVRLEDDLVLGLRKVGADGLASHTVFPDRQPTVAEIKDELPEARCDAVMVTHLVDVKLETVSVPSEPLGGSSEYSHTWGNYYLDRWNVVRTPGYTYQNKTVVLQTNLYDAANDALVWSAVTESAPSSTLDQALAGFVGVIVEDLRKDHVFSGAP